MIGNITTGRHFRGLVDYLLDPCKTPQIVDTNLSSCDRNIITWELETCASQRPSTKKPVKHISIAFAPSDQQVSLNTIEEIALAVIDEMGYGNNQYLIVQHDRVDPGHDRIHEHDHFHILINMIDLEGKRIRDNHEQKRLERILRQREIEHDLTIVPSSADRHYKAATNGQTQRMMGEIEKYQTGTRIPRPVLPHALKIQSGIDLASYDHPSLSVFLARLQQLEIDSKLRIEMGRVKGISYKFQDFKIRGCKLHRASFKQLLEHRVNYDPEADLLAVNQVNQGQEIKLDPELKVAWSQTNINNYLPDKMRKTWEQIIDQSVLQTIQLSVDVRQSQAKNNDFEIDF
jgi:Relaxase/Mobilisation nuclease domain